MKKKAQAALEFLMTYGWAILVVLVVIGALAYFGILNPTILLPEKCTLQMGMYCKNHLLNGKQDAVYLNLENGMGKGVLITKINITDPSDEGVFDNCFIDTSYRPLSDDFNGMTGWHIETGQEGVVTVHCDDMFELIGKTKAKISIEWLFDDTVKIFTHTMEGELLAKVESQGEEMCCCNMTSQGWSYDIWIPSSQCTAMPASCTSATSTFSACNMDQTNCCSIGSVFFWGDTTCSGGTIESDITRCTY